MTAYVIALMDVSNMERYQEYAKRAPQASKKYGGHAVARGKPVLLEGDDAPGRAVVLAFPSLEDAKAWYASAEYQEARTLRLGAAEFRMIAVEGL